MKRLEELLLRLWTTWGAKTRPHFGVLLLAVTLGACVLLSTHTDARLRYERTGTIVTFLSLLPDEILFNQVLFVTLKWLFVAFAACWLLHVFLPVSSWAAAALFTCLVALYQEQRPSIDHTFHLPNMILWILAIWYHCYATEIRKTLRTGRFWRAPLLPAWVKNLSLFAIAWFYTLSGMAKLADSGFNWPNGLSFQLWTHIWGDQEAWLTRLVLENRGLAATLQWTTLIIESTAVIAIFSQKARWISGLGLIGFHVSQHLIFGWPFLGNAALILLTFLPISIWFEKHVSRKQATPAPWNSRIPFCIAVRVDLWGRLRQPDNHSGASP